MITVYICTHNPKKHIFPDVLDALRQQDFPEAEYEVLVIDNASDYDLSKEYDFSGLPNFKLLQEKKLGKVNAMLHAIEHGRGDLFIMVDDDNILREDYLSVAWKIHLEKPDLGAYGGSNIGRYLKEPQKWFYAHEAMIAVKTVDEDYQSTDPDDGRASPVGAGLVFIKAAALRFQERVTSDPRFRFLDRSGGRLMGGADIYVSLCACELGLARGVSKEWSLQHVIPGERIELSYLLPLAEAAGYSHIVMKYILSGSVDECARKVNLTLRQKIGRFRSLLFKDKNYVAVKQKIREGTIEALRDIRSGKIE